MSNSNIRVEAISGPSPHEYVNSGMGCHPDPRLWLRRASTVPHSSCQAPNCLWRHASLARQITETRALRGLRRSSVPSGERMTRVHVHLARYVPVSPALYSFETLENVTYRNCRLPLPLPPRKYCPMSARSLTAQILPCTVESRVSRESGKRPISADMVTLMHFATRASASTPTPTTSVQTGHL